MVQQVRLDAPTRTSLARGGVYSTVGLAAQGVLRFATSFLIGRLAGKSELGVVASAIATALTLAVLWPTSTGSAASKFLARARGAGGLVQAQQIAAHLRRRTIQAALLLGLASLPMWVVLGHGSWQGALVVASLTVAYSGYSFTRGIQYGTGHVPRATAWDVATVLLGLVALVTLLVLGVRGILLVLPLVLTYSVYAIASWPYAGGGSPTRERRRELDVFVLLGAIGSLASTGFLQLSQIAARLAGGNADAGQYAAALTLATPASLLAGSLSLVLLPSLSETWGSGDLAGFRAQTDRATRALAVVMVGIFGTIVVCSRLIVGLVWGARYAGAEKILPILVIALLATNVGMASVNALTTRSQRGNALTSATSVLGMAVGATMWFIVTPTLGLAGVALGYLSGTVVMSGIPLAVVWRQDHHHWGPLLVKVVTGMAISGGLVALEHLAKLTLLLDPVLGLVFLVLWWAMNRAVVAAALLPLLRRRRSED